MISRHVFKEKELGCQCLTQLDSIFSGIRHLVGKHKVDGFASDKALLVGRETEFAIFNCDALFEGRGKIVHGGVEFCCHSVCWVVC